MKKTFSYLLFALFVLACSEDDGPDNTAPDPVANFTASETDIETGTSVTFTNTSINATSYSWVFNGGNPSSSTDKDPVVTYNTPGVYSVSLTAVNDAGEDDTRTEPNFIFVEDPPAATMATYNVTFVGNWSAANHPTDFPSGDHFSRAIGMVHKAGAQFFAIGELASEGVEIMAETGATGELSTEIDALVNADMAAETIIGEGLASGFSEATFQITVTNEYSLVTLVSMIAPSPDWFVAIESVNLLDNGVFVDNLTVNAVTYDSGTDSGTTFNSANADTNPAENIAEITEAPLGNGTSVDPPMAMFTFVKVDP